VPPVFVDLDNYFKVLLNVLMNALQALSKGGEIRVSLRPMRKRATRRRGIGRRATDRLEPAAEMPLLDVVDSEYKTTGRAFRPLTSRASSTVLQRRAPGTGWGSASAKASFESTGAPSRSKASWDRNRRDHRSTRGEETWRQTSRTLARQTYNLLVVDDERTLRFTLKESLAEEAIALKPPPTWPKR